MTESIPFAQYVLNQIEEHGLKAPGYSHDTIYRNKPGGYINHERVYSYDMSSRDDWFLNVRKSFFRTVVYLCRGPRSIEIRLTKNDKKEFVKAHENFLAKERARKEKARQDCLMEIELAQKWP